MKNFNKMNFKNNLIVAITAILFIGAGAFKAQAQRFVLFDGERLNIGFEQFDSLYLDSTQWSPNSAYDSSARVVSQTWKSGSIYDNADKIIPEDIDSVNGIFTIDYRTTDLTWLAHFTLKDYSNSAGAVVTILDDGSENYQGLNTDGNWHTLKLDLNKDWTQDFYDNYTMTDVINARVGFQVGDQAGTIWLDHCVYQGPIKVDSITFNTGNNSVGVKVNKESTTAVDASVHGFLYDSLSYATADTTAFADIEPDTMSTEYTLAVTNDGGTGATIDTGYLTVPAGASAGSIITIEATCTIDGFTSITRSIDYEVVDWTKVTTFEDDFSTNNNLSFWQVNTSNFETTYQDSMIQIQMAKSSFVDGMMPDVPGNLLQDTVFDLRSAPYVALKIKADSIKYVWQSWWGSVPKMDPSYNFQEKVNYIDTAGLPLEGELPLQISGFDNFFRAQNYTVNMPQDSEWHTYGFHLTGTNDGDMGNISRLLFESVQWPPKCQGGKIYFDNFMVGEAAGPICQNANLKSLAVIDTTGATDSTWSMEPAFDPATTLYTITSTDSIIAVNAILNILAQPETYNASVSMNQVMQELNPDTPSDTASVTVTSVDGSSETVYKIAFNVTVPEDTTGINSSAAEKVDIYPNPADDVINITGNVSSLEIVDLTGKVVKAIIEDNITQVDVAELNAGLYIIKLDNGSAIITKKLIIE